MSLGYEAIAHGALWDAEERIKGYFRKTLMHKIRQKYFDGVSLDTYKYSEIIKHLILDRDREENVYPCIIPGWDRSPRSGRRATIYTGSTPELWKQHVQDAVNAVQHKEDEHKIIILRSWNEWGEGNYVEPDKQWGHAYLDALKEVLLGE